MLRFYNLCVCVIQFPDTRKKFSEYSKTYGKEKKTLLLSDICVDDSKSS